MANLPKRRKKRKSGPSNQMSGVRIFYRKCLKIRGDLERAAEAAVRKDYGLVPSIRGRLEMNGALRIYKDVPSFFAIAEKEEELAGWYKRPMWADARYGAR